MHGPARDIWAELEHWETTRSVPEPMVIETSGSTGVPKQVLLSRAAMRASATETHSRLGGPGQWLLALSPSYVAGAQVLFRSVLAGVEPVLLDEHTDFSSAVAAMNGARRYISLVPTQLTRMLDSPREVEAMRGFDAILLGGTAIASKLRAAAQGEGLRVVATYGMSETCGGCVYDGVALDGVAVAIANDGRIRIGGPVLFEGYHGQPDLTAQVLDQGWFLTSDAGRIDEDGRLQVLGRVDEVVISGGLNVPTPAVAARIREHRDVSAAEVIWVPDPQWGQRVVAVLVMPYKLELEQVRDFVSERLPRAWAPRQILVVDTIPLLGNGKVDRLQLRRLAAADASDEDSR